MTKRFRGVDAGGICIGREKGGGVEAWVLGGLDRLFVAGLGHSVGLLGSGYVEKYRETV